MPCPRVYVDTPLSVGACLALPQDAARHLATVLRKKPGQVLHLFNGRGGCYRAEIRSIDKLSVTVQVQAFFDEARESPLSLTLAQGISRGQHMDYTIQKAVELGVQRIVPIFTEHGNVHPNQQRQEKLLARWRKIIISACEQCGRNHLPELLRPMPFAACLEDLQASLKLMLEPRAGAGLHGLSPQKSILLLSGPEGGFSDAELQAACANVYRPVQLGPRVLRTETAAVAALAALQTLWGDLG